MLKFVKVNETTAGPVATKQRSDYPVVATDKKRVATQALDVATRPKTCIVVRLDDDVLAVMRATGPGWQTRMNAMLREALKL